MPLFGPQNPTFWTLNGDGSHRGILWEEGVGWKWGGMGQNWGEMGQNWEEMGVRMDSKGEYWGEIGGNGGKWVKNGQKWGENWAEMGANGGRMGTSAPVGGAAAAALRLQVLHVLCQDPKCHFFDPK